MQKTLVNKYFKWGKFTLDFYTGLAFGSHTIYIPILCFIIEVEKYIPQDEKQSK
jgi:hypothetical protein